MKSRSLYKLLLIATAVIPFSDIKADSTPEPALVINEIMPANIDMFLDPSMNYGSWIELYNPTAQDIDIKGWYLSNDSTDRKQCPLGDRTRIVKKGSFLTLWFGHVDDYCLDQIEFDLKYDAGVVLLSDKDGNPVCKVEYDVIPARISYARTTDGGNEWAMTGYPTPDSTNTTSKFASEQLPAPVVDVDSKLFTDQFYFKVTIPDGATLYYTKDGSTPTIDNPNVKTSSGNHTVSDTKVYRFRLYKDGMLLSPVTTRSYIRTSNNYGVPVVSIVTDNDGLYLNKEKTNKAYALWEKGPYGKAGNGQSDLCNWNRDWDRPVNIEVIDVNGKMVINQEAEITPSGRYSRAYNPRPFKVKAKKRYGYDNYFAFTPFPDKPYNKYQSIKLRGGGNNNKARLKDAALQQIMIRSGLDIDCQSYMPVHHYINGVYKGVINFREPNNKDFAYSNYGWDDDEVDCFKLDHNFGNGGFVLTEGSRAPWDEWVQLAKTAGQDASYQRICEIVDIDEFANYMAVEFYLGNEDWPRNNIKAFRHNTPDGRYRFVVLDLDHSFGSPTKATSINPFTSFDSQEYYDNGGYKSVMVTLFHNMLQNSTFRKKFIDSYCIVAGSIYDPDRVKAIVNELADRARKEMKFYNNEKPDDDANLITNTITADYRQNRINQLVNWSYSSLGRTTKATKTISSDLPQAVLTLNGMIIPTNKFVGQVFLPVKVKAIAPNGYTFAGWTDNNGKIVSWNAEYNLSSSTENIRATFVPDSQFQRPVRINEVCASNNVFINDSFKKHDWIELYNTTPNAIDAGGMYLSDDLDKPGKYTLPQGTTIPAKGYLVIWCDKEEGTQLHASFKLDNKQENVVVLTAADHSWADTLIYKSHTEYQSVGLYPDGGSTSYVMNRPSIGRKNNRSTYDAVDREKITAIKALLNTPKKDLIYNLLGQPVASPQPGQLYIKNGRKFYYRP